MALPTVEGYDPETDIWERKSDMLVPRGGHSAVAINNKIYVFGGQTGLWGPNGGPLASVVEEYDPVSDTWIKKSEMPISRNLLSVSVMNGKAYIIGGAVNMGPALPIVEEYDPLEDICLWALDKAFMKGMPEIFNSDQGSQFTNEAFTDRLATSGVRISWDGRGRAMDNIFVERLWRSVKYEEVYLKDYDSVSEAIDGIGRYFKFYNTQRLHQSFGYQTPQQVFDGR